MIFKASFFPNLIFVNPGGRCRRKQRRQRPPVVAQPQTPKVFSLFRFSVFFRFPFFGVFGFFGVFRRSRLFSAFFGVLAVSLFFVALFGQSPYFFFGESFVLLKEHMGSGGGQDFLVSALPRHGSLPCFLKRMPVLALPRSTPVRMCCSTCADI